MTGTYESAGRLEQALPLYEQTLADCRRLLGKEHPATLRVANNLAGAYESAGRLEQALPLYEQTLTNCRRVLGGEHPLSRAVTANLQRAKTTTEGPLRRRWWQIRAK
jgi:tetratricopeptide (TPR) repeat protein